MASKGDADSDKKYTVRKDRKTKEEFRCCLTQVKKSCSIRIKDTKRLFKNSKLGIR
jgi:hypothetical protein